MAVLLRMQFPNWIQNIMQCISIVSYKVILNELTIDHISPSRGLTQRDTLSPNLFIHGPNVFSMTLQQAGKKKIYPILSPLMKLLIGGQSSHGFCPGFFFPLNSNRSEIQWKC